MSIKALAQVESNFDIKSSFDLRGRRFFKCN